MGGSHEKRKNQRVPMDTGVSFSLNGHVWHDGRSINIDNQGLLVRTKEELPIGRRVHLVFKIPNTSLKDSIEAKGQVVRIETRGGRQVGLGIAFGALRPGYTEAIEEFINKLSK